MTCCAASQNSPLVTLSYASMCHSYVVNLKIPSWIQEWLGRDKVSCFLVGGRVLPLVDCVYLSLCASSESTC